MPKSGACLHQDKNNHVTELLASAGMGSRQPPAPQDWVAVKQVIKQLYVSEELPLREVKERLEQDHGFRASERMFKDRLKKWNFHKNLTRDDWIALAFLNRARKVAGKRSTVFIVRGRRRTVRDLHKYSRSQGMTEEDLANSAPADIEIPAYLRSLTPDLDVKDSPSDASQESPSPKQSPKESSTNSASVPSSSNLRGHEPWIWQTTGEDLSLQPRASFLLPLASPRDWNTSRAGSSTFYDSFSSSSGSASIAMTDSTVATSASLYQEDTINTCADATNSMGGSRKSDTSTDLASSCDQIKPRRSSGRDKRELYFPKYLKESIALPMLDAVRQSGTPGLTERVQQRDIEMMGYQLVEPAPLLSRHGSPDIGSWFLVNRSDEGDPMDIECSCARCHQPSSMHFVSLDNLIPETLPRNILNNAQDQALQLPASTKEEGAWKWVARCFLACLQMGRGNIDLAEKCLVDASIEFEKLLARRDPMLLTAANQMITILHMHDQGDIATKVMISAQRVTEAKLQPTHPVRVTIDYLTASAGIKLNETNITSTTLRGVYEQLENENGTLHPYTISAFYNYSWLLRAEARFAEAEENLRKVYITSCSIFGRNHMQSITALATLAGAQIGQGKLTEAIENLLAVIRDCEPTLGRSHPYRLEAKRRLALQYEELNQQDKMESLYWDVLVGRVRMLGKKHPYTWGARDDYEKLMKDLSKWEDGGDVDRQVEELFKEEIDNSRSRNRSNSEASSECAAF